MGVNHGGTTFHCAEKILKTNMDTLKQLLWDVGYVM